MPTSLPGNARLPPAKPANSLPQAALVRRVEEERAAAAQLSEIGDTDVRAASPRVTEMLQPTAEATASAEVQPSAGTKARPPLGRDHSLPHLASSRAPLSDVSQRSINELRHPEEHLSDYGVRPAAPSAEEEEPGDVLH